MDWALGNIALLLGALLIPLLLAAAIIQWHHRWRQRQLNRLR